jgi:hypothetical protein
MCSPGNLSHGKKRKLQTDFRDEKWDYFGHGGWEGGINNAKRNFSTFLCQKESSPD